MVTSSDTLPLSGFKVLDFTQVIGGPLATMVLADLGAEVLKIEPPTGDAARELLSITDPDARPFFDTYNRGKRSMVLDLRSEEGQAAARKLALEADIVVEAFRPGAMDRLGLGAEVLMAENPHLVYASLSGFGSVGPDSQRGGFDILGQAESGLMSVTGEPDGPPMRVGVHVVDIACGHILAQAILAAVIKRLRTHTGERVLVSLFEVACAIQAHHFTEQLTTGSAPGRSGNFPASTAPSGCYETADGAIIVASYQQGHWLKLIDCLERPDLGEDERFATLASRIAHREALVATLSEIIRARPSQEWLTRLTAAGLVAGEVRTYDQVVSSEQFRAIGLELELDSPAGERGVRTLRSPWTFSSFTGAATALSPRLGEATEGFATPAG